MANRDHTLDSKITDAAYSEFLEKGYPAASLRKIAEKAGVTVGSKFVIKRRTNCFAAC